MHQTLSSQQRWQQHLLREVSLVPGSVLPALARRIAAEKDRRITPVALAAFANRLNLPADILATLRTSPVPAVAALAEAPAPIPGK